MRLGGMSVCQSFSLRFVGFQGFRVGWIWHSFKVPGFAFHWRCVTHAYEGLDLVCKDGRCWRILTSALNFQPETLH